MSYFIVGATLFGFLITKNIIKSKAEKDLEQKKFNHQWNTNIENLALMKKYTDLQEENQTLNKQLHEKQQHLAEHNEGQQNQ